MSGLVPLEQRIDDLIMSIDGNGLTQKFAGYAVIGGIQAFTVVLFNIAYIEMSPQFKCSIPPSTQVSDCTEADFCGNAHIDFWIDFDHERSLINWSERIGLICRPGWQVGLLGSAFFAGWVSTLLWVPLFANHFGRLRVFQLSCFMSVILYVVFLFSRSYLLTLASMFLMGATTSGKLGVGYPYLMELLGKNYRPFYATLMSAATSLDGIIGTLYFIYVSKNAYYFMAGGFVWQLSSLVVSHLLPESPVYFLNKGKLRKGELALEHIAKLNGRQLTFNPRLFN